MMIFPILKRSNSATCHSQFNILSGMSANAKIPGVGKKVVFISPEGMGRSEIFQLLKQKEPPHEGNIRPAPNMARLKVKTAEREGSVVS